MRPCSASASADPANSPFNSEERIEPLLAVHGHARIVDVGAQPPQFEGALEHELVALRLPRPA